MKQPCNCLNSSCNCVFGCLINCILGNKENRNFGVFPSAFLLVTTFSSGCWCTSLQTAYCSLILLMWGCLIVWRWLFCFFRNDIMNLHNSRADVFLWTTMCCKSFYYPCLALVHPECLPLNAFDVELSCFCKVSQSCDTILLTTP